MEEFFQFIGAIVYSIAVFLLACVMSVLPFIIGLKVILWVWSWF